MTYAKRKTYAIPKFELASLDGHHWDRPSRYCYILRRDTDRKPVAVMTRGGCYGWVVRVPHPDRTDRDWHHSDRTRYATSLRAKMWLRSPKMEGRTTTSNSLGLSEQDQRETFERGAVWNWDGRDGEMTVYPYLPSGDLTRLEIQHRSAMLEDDANDEEYDGIIRDMEAYRAARPDTVPGVLHPATHSATIGTYGDKATTSGSQANGENIMTYTTDDNANPCDLDYMALPFENTPGLESWAEDYEWRDDGAGGMDLYWFDAAVGGIGEVYNNVPQTRGVLFGADGVRNALEHEDHDSTLQAIAWVVEKVEAARHLSNTAGEHVPGHPLALGKAAEEREWIDSPDGWQAYRRADGAIVVDRIGDDDHLEDVSYIAAFNSETGWWNVGTKDEAGVVVTVLMLDPFTAASSESIVEAVANLGSPSADLDEHEAADDAAQRISNPSYLPSDYSLTHRSDGGMTIYHKDDDPAFLCTPVGRSWVIDAASMHTGEQYRIATFARPMSRGEVIRAAVALGTPADHFERLQAESEAMQAAIESATDSELASAGTTR